MLKIFPGEPDPTTDQERCVLVWARREGEDAVTWDMDIERAVSRVVETRTSSNARNTVA